MIDRRLWGVDALIWFVITACILMMGAAHALRPRYMYMSFVEIPGMAEDGCRDQDDHRIECDEAHKWKPAIVTDPSVSCTDDSVKCHHPEL